MHKSSPLKKEEKHCLILCRIVNEQLIVMSFSHCTAKCLLYRFLSFLHDSSLLVFNLFTFKKNGFIHKYGMIFNEKIH